MKIQFATVLMTFALAGTTALAQNQTTITFEKAKETENLAASNRSQALVTDSMYYSLPHEDMTFLKLGAFNQRENRRDLDSKMNNQVFFFNHSRGLTENLALDFNLNYFVRDERSSRSTGIEEAAIGARSHFEAAGMNWIYGGNLMYLPEGESLDSSSKVALAARIGFEEAVDIARWGIEAEATTKDSAFFKQSLNLIGFFEIPFVKSFNMGVSAGTDFTKMTSSQQNNFARVYGQYNIDNVSAAQLNLKQTNEKNSDASLTDSEVGIALTRVF